MNQISKEVQPNKEIPSYPEIWVGEDFCAAQDYILDPGRNEISIAYPSESLPPKQGKILFPQVAIRSRYAQSGVYDVWLHQFDQSESLPTGEQLGSAVVFNVGGRPISLPKGAGLGKLFSTERAQLLHGPELQCYVRERLALTTDGQIGENIRISYNGIWVKLTDEKYFIPEEKEPINIPDASDYRRELDTNILKLAPPESAPPFLVGETEPRIKPNKGYYLIIHRTVIIGDSPYGQQARSCFMDYTSDLWRLRIETYIKEDAIDTLGQKHWVKMFIVRGSPDVRDSELPQLNHLRRPYTYY